MKKTVTTVVASAAMCLLVVGALGCSGQSASSSASSAAAGAEQSAASSASVEQSSSSAASTEQSAASTSSASSQAQTAAKDPMTANSIITGKKWQYVYTGREDAMLTAICNKMCELDAQNYEIADGMFPAIDTVRIADEEDGTIKVFAIFETYNYEMDGTVIKVVSGGRDVGRMDLKLNSDDSYTVTKVAFAEDGSGYQESLEKICKGHDDVLDGLEGAVADETRAGFIKDYSDAYGLGITAYEDTDGTRVKL